MATEMTKMVLTAKEAIFLSAVLGENTLVGVEDPFLGWLAEQVEEEWLHCRDDMIGKGFLTNSNMKMQVRDDIKTALHICCEPDLQILMEQSNMGGHLVCHIVSALRSGTSLAVMHTMNSEVSIKLIKSETSSELVEAIMAELVLDDSMISDASKMQIPEELLIRTLEIPDMERPSFLLAALHMQDRSNARDCAQAICNSKRKFFVSVNQTDSERHLPDSYGLFEGEKCLVRLCISTERSDMLVAEIITTSAFQKQLAGYLT